MKEGEPGDEAIGCEFWTVTQILRPSGTKIYRYIYNIPSPDGENIALGLKLKMKIARMECVPNIK